MQKQETGRNDQYKAKTTETSENDCCMVGIFDFFSLKDLHCLPRYKGARGWWVEMRSVLVKILPVSLLPRLHGAAQRGW